MCAPAWQFSVDVRAALIRAIHRISASALQSSLFPQLIQVLVIEPIGDRNELLMPAIIAGFVAAQKKNGRMERIEGVQAS